MNAGECFFASVDSLAMVAGTITTKLLIEEHWSNFDLDSQLTRENLCVEHTVDVRGEGYAPDDAPEPLIALTPLLIPEALKACTSDDGEFEPYALLAAIANGQNVFSGHG